MNEDGRRFGKVARTDAFFTSQALRFLPPIGDMWSTRFPTRAFESRARSRPRPVDAEDEDEEEPENAVLSEDERLQTADPLKLYVRQIGDGRLLTPPRSASSRGARTSGTSSRSGA